MIFQSFNLTQDVKEKNLMPVTFVATNVLQDHTNIHTGENHMCAKFVVMQDINTDLALFNVKTTIVECKKCKKVFPMWCAAPTSVCL